MNGSLLHNAKPDDAGKRFSTSDPYQERRAYVVTSDKPVIDKEARTVELSFSSETPVERWFGSEVLVHSADAIDFSRLNNGHPLLCNHDPEEQIGVVVRAWLDESTRKARAVVKFSRSADGEEVFQDVQDGIRGLVSVGYRVNSWLTEDTNGDGEPEVYRAVKWTPYEISIVSVPADPNVGVGRSAEKTTNSMNKNTLFDAGAGATGVGGNGSAATNVIELNAERERARNEEQKRVREILATQAQHKERGVTAEDAQKFIAEGKSVESFYGFVLERVHNAKPIETINPNIGMSREEQKRFSICRAISVIGSGRQLDGIEREASEAHAKKFGVSSGERSFFIPNDVAANTNEQIRAVRAMSAGTVSAGGYTVDTVLDAGNMIELLRKRMVVAQAGARVLSGLQGNILIPKQSNGATAYWLSETATVTASDQVIGQLALNPKRLAATTTYSKQLVMQSSIDVEAFVRDDLMNVLAIAQDNAFINGIGAAGEPLGLLASGIATASGGTASWTVILGLWSAIATNNAARGNMSWIYNTAASAILKGKIKESGGSVYLEENERVMGLPAYITNQVATNILIFGNFSDFIIANWAGVEIEVDRVTGLPNDQLKVFAKLSTDCGVRHAESFCKTSAVITA